MNCKLCILAILPSFWTNKNAFLQNSMTRGKVCLLSKWFGKAEENAVGEFLANLQCGDNSAQWNLGNIYKIRKQIVLYCSCLKWCVDGVDLLEGGMGVNGWWGNQWNSHTPVPLACAFFWYRGGWKVRKVHCLYIWKIKRVFFNC